MVCKLVNLFQEHFSFRKTRLKGVFVIIDGLGDLPNKQLGGLTPLESATTSNLDFFATRGEIGFVYPVSPGYSPGSDESIVSIFGNDMKNSNRAWLEAVGAGINPNKGDLVLRVNFGTIDSIEKGNVIDRRAGRTLTNEEANLLAEEINKMDFPYEFKLVPTLQHRGILIFRGDFSDKIAGDDITYNKGSSKEISKVTSCRALVREDKAEKTAKMLNEFLESSFKILKDSEANISREKRGLLPANYLLVRTPGVERPKLKQYKDWACLGYMPLEKGFSDLSGMKTYSFSYPPLRGIDSYQNLWQGLKKASSHSLKLIKSSLRKHKFIYIHIKETDLPGHDNKPFEKKEMLEFLDKNLFSKLRGFLSRNKIKLIVTGDHSTPCVLKAHSSDPVPLLYCSWSLPREKKFNEKEAKKGKLGRMLGKEIFSKTGFLK